MTFLNFLYRNGIILSVPLFAISAALLAFCILGLVRLGDRSTLFTLPLIEQQTVHFTEAGRVALSLEGPRLSKRFSELGFELFAPDGTRKESSTSWFHASSSGMATIRMELVSFPVPGPGLYTLRVQNLGAAQEGDRGHRIVLSRPQLFRTIGAILGIVLSAGLLIGSVVLFILRLLSKGGEP